MYSVVLMTAITAGSASPDNWFRNRGHGCSPCGGCYACAGCWGGCHGGQCNYGYMAINGNLCHGCYAGGGCGGGWGVGSHHCAFYPGYSGCYGCYGCYGPYGSGYSYPSGGSPWGTLGCHGCFGCYGGFSCYGTALPHHGVIIDHGPVGGTPRPDPKTEETPPPKPRESKKENKDGTSLENRARVIVQLPADAKLFIDGKLMSTTSGTRAFQTPDLVPGQTYFYELKAEVVRDGRTVSETQQVILRPGQVAAASFGRLDADAATVRRDP